MRRICSKENPTFLGDEGHLLNINSPVSAVTGLEGALVISFDAERYFHVTRNAGEKFFNNRRKQCTSRIE